MTNQKNTKNTESLASIMVSIKQSFDDFCTTIDTTIDTTKSDNHGTVTHNGKTITLTQDAYITSNGSRDYYRAHAVDANQNEYYILWDIIDADCDDESNACDWSNPSDIISID